MNDSDLKQQFRNLPVGNDSHRLALRRELLSSAQFASEAEKYNFSKTMKRLSLILTPAVALMMVALLLTLDIVKLPDFGNDSADEASALFAKVASAYGELAEENEGWIVYTQRHSYTEGTDALRSEDTMTDTWQIGDCESFRIMGIAKENCFYKSVTVDVDRGELLYASLENEQGLFRAGEEVTEFFLENGEQVEVIPLAPKEDEVICTPPEGAFVSITMDPTSDAIQKLSPGSSSEYDPITLFQNVKNDDLVEYLGMQTFKDKEYEVLKVDRSALMLREMEAWVNEAGDQFGVWMEDGDLGKWYEYLYIDPETFFVAVSINEDSLSSDNFRYITEYSMSELLPSDEAKYVFDENEAGVDWQPDSFALPGDIFEGMEPGKCYQNGEEISDADAEAWFEEQYGSVSVCPVGEECPVEGGVLGFDGQGGVILLEEGVQD